jgi:hypothetical protein
MNLAEIATLIGVLFVLCQMIHVPIQIRNGLLSAKKTKLEVSKLENEMGLAVTTDPSTSISKQVPSTRTRIKHSYFAILLLFLSVPCLLLNVSIFISEMFREGIVTRSYVGLMIIQGVVIAGLLDSFVRTLSGAIYFRTQEMLSNVVDSQRRVIRLVNELATRQPAE